MSIRKNRFTRRSYLKAITAGGASISLGLPLLESQLNSSGTALAQGEPLPGFYGVWFAGGGVWPGAFLPVGTGADWRLPQGDERLDWMRSREPEGFWASSAEFYNYTDAEHALGLLATPEYRNLFTLVSGQQVNGRGQHISGQTECLSGTNFIRRSGDSLWIYGAESSDQTVGKQHGIQPLVMAADPDETGYPAHSFMSFRKDEGSEAAWTVPYIDHLKAFADLFGSFEPSESSVDASVEQEMLARRSMLDYLRPQLSGLKGRVSALDQQRIEQHLTGLREIEADLERTLEASSICEPGEAGEAASHIERHKQMSRIAVLALSCGVRSTFALSCTRSQSDLAIEGGGVANHPLQHRGFLGDGLHEPALLHAAIRDQPAAGRTSRLNNMAPVRRAVRTQMDLYADLMAQMNAVPFGAGTLLDASAVVGTFEMWDGNSHNFDEHPVFVAGGANGRLRMGQHLRDEAGGHPARVLVSAMRAVVQNPEEIFLGDYSDGYSDLET